MDALQAEKEAGEERIMDLTAQLQAASAAQEAKDAHNVELLAELASLGDRNTDLSEALEKAR